MTHATKLWSIWQALLQPFASAFTRPGHRHFFAWITAMAGAVAHIIVLALRLSTEERVLFANPDYAAAMSSKPRFLPGLF